MMYDRLKQLVLEAALPAELGGRTIPNKYKNPLGISTGPNTKRLLNTPQNSKPAEMGGNSALRARLLANLRASRAARGKSNFDTFSRSQDAIAAYKAKEAEQKKQDAQKKISGALKSSGAGALVGNAIAKRTELQGATKRKAAPGSLV